MAESGLGPWEPDSSAPGLNPTHCPLGSDGQTTSGQAGMLGYSSWTLTPSPRLLVSSSAPWALPTSHQKLALLSPGPSRSWPHPHLPSAVALRSGRGCRRQKLAAPGKPGPLGGGQARRNSVSPSNRHLATASHASAALLGPGLTEVLTWPEVGGGGARSRPGEVLPPGAGPLLQPPPPGPGSAVV